MSDEAQAATRKRRRLIALAAAALAALAVAGGLALRNPQPAAPRFVPVAELDFSRPIDGILPVHSRFRWHSQSSPYLFVSSRFIPLGDTLCYIVDLRKPGVVGAVRGARVVAYHPDLGVAVCSTRERGLPSRAARKRREWLANMNRRLHDWLKPHGITLPRWFRHSVRVVYDTYWLVPLDGTPPSILVAQMPEAESFLSHCSISPSGKKCFILSNAPGHNTIYVDLEYRTAAQNPPWFVWRPSRAPGWWSDDELLTTGFSGNVWLCKTEGGGSRTVLTRADLESVLAADPLTSASKLTVRSIELSPRWDGHRYQFEWAHASLIPGSPHVTFVRVDREAMRFELEHTDLYRRWPRSLDETGRYWMCANTRMAGHRILGGEILVRDRQTGSDRVVLSTAGGKHPAILAPAWHEDSILYIRDGEVRMIRCDGTGDRRILPPPGAPPPKAPKWPLY